MPSLNKVMLIGNVGKDPDVRYVESAPSQQGQSPKVATFTLATTEKYRDRSGEVKDLTEWHNIVAWRGLADTIEKYVRKGSQIFVEGRIRTRSWTDQSGAKQYRTEIVADNIQLLGRRSDSQGAQDGGYSPANGGYGPTQSGHAQQGDNQPHGGYGQTVKGQQGGYARPSAPQPVSPAPVPSDAPDDLPF